MTQWLRSTRRSPTKTSSLLQSNRRRWRTGEDRKCSARSFRLPRMTLQRLQARTLTSRCIGVTRMAQSWSTWSPTTSPPMRTSLIRCKSTTHPPTATSKMQALSSKQKRSIYCIESSIPRSTVSKSKVTRSSAPRLSKASRSKAKEIYWLSCSNERFGISLLFRLRQC